jgi:hypothetical protein
MKFSFQQLYEHFEDLRKPELIAYCIPLTHPEKSCNPINPGSDS